MSKDEMKFRLTTLLLREGQAALADHLGISSSELSKKLNGENGWKLEQFAAALDFVDAQLIAPEDGMVTIKRSELEAYKALALAHLQEADGA